MRGVVFPGSKNCSMWWTPELREQLRGVLGYTPVPGSLNLAILNPFRLPHAHIEFWDRRRPRVGKKGGTYQFWPARFGYGEHAISAHIMRPDTRGHGQNCVELVAPIVLREEWGLENGSKVWVRVKT